ncbi:MAG TPA: NUDIX domain-containing protein [Armatimonadota bacterium]|jgi:8-oxo-dGTP pyrophosphatase MutT (NUDIX family)
MARRVSFSNWNRRRGPAQETRIIVTALLERDDSLLLAQLAHGRFAGFWLLPSATVDESTVAATARRMVPERTGYPVAEQTLLSVVEEPMTQVLALRFVFSTQVGEQNGPPEDPEIARVHWFTRSALQDLLAEREVVPALGVMSLLRGWAEGLFLQPLETLNEDTLCPCGSGHRYAACCGWDTR